MPVAWTKGVETIMKRQTPNAMPSLTPEYIAYTNASQILSITGAHLAMALIVVLLRCYVRIFMLKVFGKDDHMMIVSTIFAIITFACFVLETENGLGKHFLVLLMDAKMYENFARILYVHSLMVMVGVSCVKISIAFALLRLSANRGQSRFLWGVIMFIIVFTIFCAGTLVFQCIPVRAAWDSTLRPAPLGTGNARCWSSNTFRNLGFMNSLFNIITDVLFATLPIPLIWKLQINMRTKISLIAVLSLGWFACAAAIVKAALQYRILEDPDWSVHDSFMIWNYIELTIGIVAASLPALRPLFNWALNTAKALSSEGRTRMTGRGTTSFGYRTMASRSNSHSNESIKMHSMHGKDTADDVKSPYSVEVSTLQPIPSGRADKEAWDTVNAKDSNESIRPIGLGPRDITVTTEVRVS